MDDETVSAEEFGASLRGLGVNIIVTDVLRTAKFLTQVFDITGHRLGPDFAIMRYGDQVFQLHSDGTFGGHPLHGLLPESPPRGTGIELRLYDTDPDTAAAKAETAGGMVLQPPTDKPHGLRECVILDADGYAWVPSRPLK